MTKYFARVVDAIVVETIQAGNSEALAGLFHPDVVKDIILAKEI